MTECEVILKDFVVRRGRVRVYVKELCIEKGRKVCIVGESGSGKTSLLDAISGLLKFQGYLRRPKFFYLPYYVSYPPFQTIEAFIRQNALNTKCSKPSDYMKRVSEYLTAFGLEDVRRKLGELSDGERRRVFLAGALAHNCELLLIDEPFQALDPANVVRIAEHLRRYKGTGIYVIHNYFGLSACDDVFLLEKGELKTWEVKVKTLDGCTCYCQ